MRRADAGYDLAIDCARERRLRLPEILGNVDSLNPPFSDGQAEAPLMTQNLRFIQLTVGDNQAWPKMPGCYLITAPNFRDSLPRLFAVDPLRVLYIGQSRGLIRQRLSLFFNIASRQGDNRRHVNHPGANRYFLIRDRMTQIGAAYDQLSILYAETSNDCSHDAEQYLLLSYMVHFGEVPPLNGTLRVTDQDRNVLQPQHIRYNWPVANLRDFEPQ